ncbi:hypothetical protein HNQ71_001789 [Mesorhizobium sangaii]|uniref:Uncharacterized protein n=2 Tax=Mesorhizobium sangaii TaxID=505389 RepID=A0A841PKZ3_9HYPH|nr:hypothetical protein [Mesorhizobium sangaii]MBB6409145.1 hypothetical protein [Mesorhizobium sangaii]
MCPGLSEIENGQGTNQKSRRQAAAEGVEVRAERIEGSAIGLRSARLDDLLPLYGERVMREPAGQDEYGSSNPFDPDDLPTLNAIGPSMGSGNDFEKYAVAVIIVFGALIIGGLMAASMTFGHRNGFLFALGGATSAWVSGNALLLDRPRIYALFVGIAALLLIASTVTLIS